MRAKTEVIAYRLACYDNKYLPSAPLIDTTLTILTARYLVLLQLFFHGDHTINLVTILTSRLYVNEITQDYMKLSHI